MPRISKTPYTVFRITYKALQKGTTCVHSLRPTFKLGSVFLQANEPGTKLLLMRRIGELAAIYYSALLEYIVDEDVLELFAAVQCASELLFLFTYTHVCFNSVDNQRRTGI